jgi:hypothetical protein
MPSEGQSSLDHEPLTDDPLEPGRVHKIEHIPLVREQRQGRPLRVPDYIERLPEGEVRLHKNRLIQINDPPETTNPLLFFRKAFLIHGTGMIQLHARLFNQFTVLWNIGFTSGHRIGRT